MARPSFDLLLEPSELVRAASELLWERSELVGKPSDVSPRPRSGTVVAALTCLDAPLLWTYIRRDLPRGPLDQSIVGRLTAALADRYRIERDLGAGRMATVYLAHDLRHDRQVAIKVLHEDLGATLGPERFLAEIKTTAKLQHPHVLPLLDSGSTAASGEPGELGLVDDWFTELRDTLKVKR